MKSKWRAKLSKLGIAEHEVSVSLKKSIAEFVQVESGLETLNDQLEDADESKVEGIQEQIDKYENVLGQYDDLIVAKIEKWYANRDANRAKMEKMQAARRAKKAARQKAKAAEPTPESTPMADPEPTPAVEPHPAPTPEPTPDPTPAPVAVIEDPAQNEPKTDEKGSNAIWWVVGGIAAAVGLGALARAFKRD